MRILVALIALLGLPVPAEARADVDRGVQDAFQFAFPVYQIARTRAEAIAAANAAGRAIVNRFNHRARLAGPADRAVTTPNNDTLYSSAWLDLRDGPVVLTIPAMPRRYHSVALMDVFTDNFSVVGTRATDGRGGRYLITPPGWRGRLPRGMRRIGAPTLDVWALSRVVVDGPDDLPEATAAQARIDVSPLVVPATATGSRPSRPPPPRQPDARRFLLEVNALLGAAPLGRGHARRAHALRRFGIAPGAGDVWGTLTPEVRAGWDRLPTMIAGLRDGLAATGTLRDGWIYPKPGLGRFGDDDRYRAEVAMGGLAALPREEATYMTATGDATGAPLDGSRNYTLRLPANIPVRAFWSLSMYQFEPDGRLFFTPNAIDRYAIGDRTPGLVRDPDGGLTLYLQRDRPEGTAAANWLPTPRGPFRMTFRAYLPGTQFQNGRFRLPPVIPR